MSLEKKDTENMAPDVWRLLKRSKRKILTGALILGLIGAILAVTRPVLYRAEGSFREKGLKQSNMNSTLLDLLASGSKGMSMENEAISILKSQKTIYPLINQLHLQGKISREQDRDRYIRRIKNNVLVELAYLARIEYPILEDMHCPLSVSSVDYPSETPEKLKIFFPDADNHYQVFDSAGKLLGTGQLDKPFQFHTNEFTLTCQGNLNHVRQTYYLDLWPKQLLMKHIKKNLRVENDHLDKNLLLIDYKDQDRQFASKFVNGLMSNYQGFLKEDLDLQAATQVAYLQEKQDEAEGRLQKLMQKHAKTLSEDLSNNGFADSKKEMEFLAKSQHEFKERLISNELEIKRLQNVQNGQCVYYDQFGKNAGDHHVINSVLKEIRDLKQQRDALSLALKNSPYMDPIQLQKAFYQQKIELDDVTNHLLELDQILHDFEQNLPLNSHLKLVNDPSYLIGTWYSQFTKTPDTEAEKEQFKFYLNNLKRLFTVHAKIIQERLAHQQNPSSEYQGIQLDAARELYLNYSIKLNELEAKKRENTFVINQMKDPLFEITSLSSILSDPVSGEMIQKASRLVLDLKDQNNRSDKEQEQIREELSLERGFLLLHLQQTNQLVELNQKLVEEKMYALQNTMLELIHQQISVREKNLHDYINTRLDNLKQEHAIIQGHMDELHQEMATLPKRWASEKMIEQNLEINELILQEVAKMVESKNISHKMELVQSSPIDVSVPPVHPLSSGLTLFSLLGGLVGGLITFGFILRKDMSEGFIASTMNLKKNHQHVSGRLVPQNQEMNLETLRRLQSYLTENNLKPTSQTLLLIEGDGLDYSSDLANLFYKKGEKPVILDLNFSHATELAKAGLLQYLEGDSAFPAIQKGATHDFIEAGGFSFYSNELLCSDRFKILLEELGKTYVWIIAVCHTKPNSAMAESLLSSFSYAAVTVQDETIKQLETYIKFSQEYGKKISFLMSSLDDVE